MSTVQKVRYMVAVVLAVLACGFFMEGEILIGIVCALSAVSLLPLLYQLLMIRSTEVQVLSPLVLMLTTLFLFYVFKSIPPPYDAPFKTTYHEYVAQTTVTTSESTATTQTTQPSTYAGETVYRTPSGKRYHVDAFCGGENAYEVTVEEAMEAGLTPCKRCVGE